MKAPTAKKLPSGQWFCRVRVNGEDVGITRQTEKEAVAEAMAVKAGIKKAAKTPAGSKTVKKAIDDYIDMKSNILSPETIRGYRIIQRNRFKSVMNRKIGDITEPQWQRIVNDEAKTISAKTLKNSWGLLATVIKIETRQDMEISLPQVVSEEHEFLDVEQVKQFIKAVKGKKIEIPALLALSSLRASEIAALAWENIDLEKSVIHIRGAAVHDENGKLVKKKENKNTSSRRDVPMIEPLKTALMEVKNKTGPVCHITMGTARRQINEVCEEANLPKVGVHGLRHSFASLSVFLDMPMDVTMKIAGWKNYKTMKNRYTHISQRDLTKAAEPLLAFFNTQKTDQKTENGNENGNEIKSILEPQSL